RAELAREKGRPDRCYRATNDLVPWSLSIGALAGKQRVAATGVELRKLRESTPRELLAQPLGRHVDRGLGAAREGKQRIAAGRDEASDLVEEGDHVRVRDELERAVAERKRRRIGALVPNALAQLRRRIAPGVIEHRLRHVDADDLGVGETL